VFDGIKRPGACSLREKHEGVMRKLGLIVGAGVLALVFRFEF
jgi:hypothetical protein